MTQAMATTNRFEALKRCFKLGALKLDDPCPGKSLDEAVRILARNFPQFRAYRLWEEDGVIEGDSVVFTLKMPPAKDNG